MKRKALHFYHNFLARRLYQLLIPFQKSLNLKKRTFFDKFQVRTSEGYSFYLYNNAFRSETEIFWQGFENIHWENKTREIWKHLSKNCKVILDIGANTGIFSLLSAVYNKNAIIYAFEPQPNIFNVLVKNNHINKFNIQCYPLALSNRSGILPFYNTGFSTFEGNNTTHGSLNKEWRTKIQASIMVEVERLDKFIENKKIKNIELMKIDVETLEFEVLNGYGKFLNQHRPIIILEIQNSDIGNKICLIFHEMGYKFFWINEDSGLICVNDLGINTNQENLNYILLPIEKQELISDYIVDGL